MSVRDEPLTVPTPTSFKPDLDYYEKGLERAKNEKKHLLTVSDEDFHQEMTKAHLDAITSAQRTLDRYLELDKKYEAILNDISAWDCPEECRGIKDFAIEQITISRPDISLAKENLAKTHYRKSDEEAKKTLLEHCDWEINYHQENIRREIKNAEEKTKFMQSLIESLKQFDEKGDQK